MSLLSKIKDEIESMCDYWNGDRNDAAMYDALLHIESRLDEVVELVEDAMEYSVLDNCWNYCDEVGLPHYVGEFGGSGFSSDVYVTDGKHHWVDRVIFPHGLHGGDTEPKFCQVGTEQRKIIAWMHIPQLQKRKK